MDFRNIEKTLIFGPNFSFFLQLAASVDTNQNCRQLNRNLKSVVYYPIHVFDLFENGAVVPVYRRVCIGPLEYPYKNKHLKIQDFRIFMRWNPT